MDKSAQHDTVRDSVDTANDAVAQGKSAALIRGDLIDGASRFVREARLAETSRLIGEKSAEVVVGGGICRALTGGGKPSWRLPETENPTEGPNL